MKDQQHNVKNPEQMIEDLGAGSPEPVTLRYLSLEKLGAVLSAPLQARASLRSQV